MCGLQMNMVFPLPIYLLLHKEVKLVMVWSKQESGSVAWCLFPVGDAAGQPHPPPLCHSALCDWCPASCLSLRFPSQEVQIWV